MTSFSKQSNALVLTTRQTTTNEDKQVQTKADTHWMQDHINNLHKQTSNLDKTKSNDLMI